MYKLSPSFVEKVDYFGTIRDRSLFMAGGGTEEKRVG
jgi:hypothetical protein